MTVTVVDTDYEGFVQAVLPQVELAGEAKPKKTRAKKAAKAEEATEETAE